MEAWGNIGKTYCCDLFYKVVGEESWKDRQECDDQREYFLQPESMQVEMASYFHGHEKRKGIYVSKEVSDVLKWHDLLRKSSFIVDEERALVLEIIFPPLTEYVKKTIEIDTDVYVNEYFILFGVPIHPLRVVEFPTWKKHALSCKIPTK